MFITVDHPTLTVARQCALLGLARSSRYYAPATRPARVEADAALMRLIDRQYTATPFYGVRRMAVMDWFSRYVLAWELSLTLEADFCVTALQRALAMGAPEIFNTDQGTQFSSAAFTGVLQGASIAISMDGRRRAFDNIFIERL